MILTEQNYNNLNRRYFHGSKTGELSQTENLLFLTNSFVYSAFYACSEDALKGKVFEFRLKGGLNIFNTKSKPDVLKVRGFLKKSQSKLNDNWYWKGLENEDWTFIFGDTNYRGQLIRAIKECNFDGFFDWEWTDNLKSSKYRNTEKGQFIEKSPAVGIFNVSKVSRVAEYKYLEYFNFEDFYKTYQKEKSLVIGYSVAVNQIEKDIEESVLYFAQLYTSFLLYEDVIKIIENVNNFEPYIDYDPNIYDPEVFKECKKVGNYKNQLELDSNNQLVFHKDREQLRKVLGKKSLDEIDHRRKLLNKKLFPKKHLNKN